MYNVLCYGDSNTWGTDMSQRDRLYRLAYDKRWTGVLAHTLGNEFKVHEEGLPGRTTAFEDPFGYGRNGEKTLEVAFLTHDPIDVLVIMLGTNDMKEILKVSPEDSAWGLEREIIKARQILSVAYTKELKILVVSPIHLERADDGKFYYGFTENSIKKSRELAAYYEKTAQLHQCEFLDASIYAKASLHDGVHIKNEDNEPLGKAIAGKISGMFA